MIGYETGRRGESFMAWVWGDIDLVKGKATWRRELDKQGEPSKTALSDPAVAQLRARCGRLSAPPGDEDAALPVTPRPIAKPRSRFRVTRPDRLAEYGSRYREWEKRTQEARAKTQGHPDRACF